ncbi:MAG TPA: LytR C-terminal domain-containing protein [Pyrinomonadaceae bacterium]
MTQTTPQTPERKLNLGRLERLQRLLQYGAALVLLVFVALIALAWTELRDLNARRDKAREALTKAEQALAAVNDELALKKNALDAAQSVNTVLSNVADAYKEEHPEKAELVNNALRNAVEASITESAEKSGQQTQAAEQVPPRVYIQIMNGGQRSRAREVAGKLQAQGFIVPGVENMERKGHRQANSDVRFYGNDPAAAPDVENIRAVLGGFGVKLKTIALNASSAVRPRHYELWLGDDFVAPEGPSRPEAIPGLGTILTRPTRVNANTATAPERRPTPDQRTTDRTYPRRTSP